MTEYAVDLLGELTSPSLNGHEEPETVSNDMAIENTPGPRVDAARGVFITSRGTEIEFSSEPVSAMIVQRLSQLGKPKIPMTEVTLIGKHKQLEAHPQDEGYLALLDQWREEAEIRTGTYMFNKGVKGQPPQDFIDEHTPLFPEATPAELKYLWVCSMLPTDDIILFTEALISRAAPTAKGLEEAANFTA